MVWMTSLFWNKPQVIGVSAFYICDIPYCMRAYFSIKNCVVRMVFIFLIIQHRDLYIATSPFLPKSSEYNDIYNYLSFCFWISIVLACLGSLFNSLHIELIFFFSEFPLRTLIFFFFFLIIPWLYMWILCWILISQNLSRPWLLCQLTHWPLSDEAVILN